MNNKISTFGASGFIGSRFCELYKDSTIKIDREDRIPKSNEILYMISTVDNYNIHSNLQIDIDTNLKILMEVLENVRKMESPTVINFVSSWFVYGQNTETPFREDSSCNPTGFYSITKHCAEQMLICFCSTFDIKYRIFRLANVIGEGDNKISRKKNALQFLVKEVVNNRDVHLYYGGEVLRDYIYVDDVCDAIKLCIDKAPINQIINIGSGNPYRFLDIINQSIKVSESKSKIINIEPTRFHNIVQVRDSYLDIKKMRSYGFEQKYHIDDVIKKLVDHYKSVDI
jgi:nucleoside-diphosphate-sugar epimerase